MHTKTTLTIIVISTILMGITKGIPQITAQQNQKPWLEVVDPITGTNLIEYDSNPPSAIGEIFSVRIEMRGLQQSLQLFNVSLALAFNSTLLEAVDVIAGNYMQAGNILQKTVFNKTLSAERIVINQYYINETTPTYPSGNGTLAIAKFNITYQGVHPRADEANLTITDIVLTGIDQTGQQYSILVDETKMKHGIYRIKGLASVEISVLNAYTEDNKFPFYTSNTSKGTRFNSTVKAHLISDLFAYQVKLFYNSSLLEVTRAWLPKWDPQWVFYQKITVSPPIDIKNDFGFVLIGDSLMEETTFSGTGTLAIVEFQILAAPAIFGKLSSVLNITNTDTYLLDSDLKVVPPVIMTNGIYEYIWAEALPELEITPAEYQSVEKEMFNVTVWINKIEDSKNLTSVEFELRYNATLLNAIQVIEEPFLTEFGFTFDYYFGVGNTTIKYHMNPPYANFPSGSGPIATIIFQGIYQDSKEHNSTLELVNISLKDHLGNNIATASPKNGLYKILSSGASILTINVDPLSLEEGFEIIINGTLKPRRSNITITIYYRPKDGTWTTLTNVTTDTSSNYIYIWATANVDPGTYELQARWPGDVNINPAESEIRTIIIKPKPSFLDFTLYAAIGAGVAILIAISAAIYLLKIRKH